MDKAGVSRTGLRKRQRGKQGEFTRCQGGRLGFPLRITESRWGEHWRERRKEGSWERGGILLRKSCTHISGHFSLVQHPRTLIIRAWQKIQTGIFSP